jgi:DNA-binding HxlR family transcriptional regulator
MGNVNDKCSVGVTIDVAGGKWKPVIIYHLIKGSRRFGELKKMIGDVSQRSLTLQLRELESDGIVNRRVYAEVPPRVEYSLTELGESLKPILEAMKKWGDEFTARNDAR